METLEIENHSNQNSRFRAGWNLGLKIILGFGCVGVILAFSIGLTVNSYNEHEPISSNPSVRKLENEISEAFLSSETSKSETETKLNTGIDSPYRYDCNEWKCTPLDDYVWRDNKDWKYEEVASYGSLVGPRAVKTFVMNMTSQNWLTEDDVDRTLWYHEIVISLPKKIHPDFAKSCIIYIDGGGNKPDQIMPEDDINVVGSQQIALMTDSCVAIIRQVPNQKLYFKNDERRGKDGREEDDIIAWTWKHFFMYPNQPDWLVRLPMTKTVRLGLLLTTAFDMINEKIQAEKIKPIHQDWLNAFGDVIDEFTVTGASKRGWTTWTIGAVDKRVKAMAPLVLDCLNMRAAFSDWWQNLGGWSFALGQYYNEDLTKYIDEPVFDKMADVIDPFTYRERMSMPKIVISATGDEFFQPDDSYNWFNEMPGQTYVRLLPNSEHGMIPPQALSSPSIIHTISFGALYISVQKKYHLPNLKFNRFTDEKGHIKIILQSDTQASLVNGWIADTDNSTRRDWRWARVKTDKVDWPTNSETVDFDTDVKLTNMESLIYSDIKEIIGDEYHFPSQQNEQTLKDSVSPYWRDMVQIQPIKWHNVRVETLNQTTWMLDVPPSYNGFRGGFIEVSFQGPDDRSKLTMTTEIQITPDMRPFPKCHGEECIGYLL